MILEKVVRKRNQEDIFRNYRMNYLIEFNLFLSFIVFGLLSSLLLLYSYAYFGLLPVFHVELGSLHRTSNRLPYLIHDGRLSR